jgi:trimethylamine--corrinoid protein Co-methyltransferase
LYYQDPISDELVRFSRAHLGSLTRLGNALSGFDAVSTVGIIQDAPPWAADLFAALEMVANTVKPLVLLVSADEAFGTVLDLLEHLCGDLSSTPFVLPYVNPISPLVINGGTVDKMRVASERGLPVIYSTYGMAGASTPITPAGTLALQNAELLAGLALSQSIRVGTPVVLGGLPAFFDMRGMGSFYDPRSYLVDLACAEMMAHYRLPHCGTSGSGMGWGADLISSGHQWFNHLVSCAGKVGLVPFVGDTLGSKAFSPTTIVYANEVIEQARCFAKGFQLDAESLALNETIETGPGGSFLMRDLTLKMFREASYSSDIFPRLTLEKWQDRGQPTADHLLRNHTQHLLHTVPAPGDYGDLVGRGGEFIRSVVD